MWIIGVVEPEEIVGTSIGPLAKVSDFLGADVHKVSPLPVTSDASTSSTHEGTGTMQNNSLAFEEMYNSLLSHLHTIRSNISSK